jgi:hypothetical protein
MNISVNILKKKKQNFLLYFKTNATEVELPFITFIEAKMTQWITMNQSNQT